MPGGIFSENLPHIVLCILNKGVVAAQEYSRQYVALFHWKKGKMSGWTVGAQASVQNQATGNYGAEPVYMHMIQILSQYMTVDHIIMVRDGSMNGNEGF